ncbi:MAG: MCE family protein [Nitrospira sp.]|jgi:phospholipid/cholesterol/gamma-HCH transport system substrate-binding protein|nr:MCE family protein [Nitrospira sp.]MDH4243613.1 MCE family protein [Nitrospira sp.]MDH4355140.1 MCE family protein [Nitrospira sp.]MDH5317563.1 MCE family protein [Nitrospira sp.]
MEPKVNYILVGSFVAFLGAAVLVGILWLGKTDYRGSYDRYEAYMKESVAGLSVDSTVKYRGVDVGRVRDIALRPDNPEEVLLILDIARGTPIKTDTLAVLETQGLTGLATVNLTGGSREAPALVAVEGQMYPVIKTGPSLFFRLDEAVSRLLSEEGLAQLIVHLDSAAVGVTKMLDEENQTLLKRTIKDLSDVAQTIAAHRTQIDQSLNGAAKGADNLVKLTASLNAQVPTLLAGINKSVVALDRATEELAKTSKTVGTVVNESKPELQQFTKRTLPEAGLLVTELRQLTGTLTRVARELEREPSSLVFGRKAQPRGPGE